MSAGLPTISQTCDASTLMVLLPGAYMTAQDFVTNGFFSAVAERALKLDLIAVDLDLADISDGSALPLVEAEIIEPARRQGYQKIWLGGISLGGLLALCHKADSPRSADGLCLLAPYPGSRLTINAINRSGGLDHWQPTAEELDDPEFRAWHWLQQPPANFPVYVGYGEEDRFANGMRQIASRFPPKSSHAIIGGHEWPVWRQLWDHFLDHGFQSE